MADFYTDHDASAQRLVAGLLRLVQNADRRQQLRQLGLARAAEQPLSAIQRAAA